jgi:hypothetical protein
MGRIHHGGDQEVKRSLLRNLVLAEERIFLGETVAEKDLMV